MRIEFQTPAIYLRVIRVISLLVPKQFRFDWRREWEAEVISRWLLLEKWNRLDGQSKFDLLRRVQGAFRDVVCFQQGGRGLVLVALHMLIALLTGFGALA